MMRRRKTRQELRSDIDWTWQGVGEQLEDDQWLQYELRELESYDRGIDRWLYLWNSPWFEYDAPPWVYSEGLDEQTWWKAWAECPLDGRF
jgi:hypothetical protein